MSLGNLHIFQSISSAISRLVQLSQMNRAISLSVSSSLNKILYDRTTALRGLSVSELLVLTFEYARTSFVVVWCKQYSWDFEL